MTCPAFVLHLLRAEKRRVNAHVLRDSCGPKAEIWPAVDGAAMSSGDLSSTVGGPLFGPTYPFPLKSGEIGCFLSHRQIWAEIVRRGAPAALIIEDDAGLDPINFGPALDMAMDHIETLGYIQFQTRAPKGSKALVGTRGTATLIVPEIGGLRTTAQLVSGWAAAHLLSLSETIDRPVDTFVQSHWHTGLRPAVLYPSGISEIAHTLDGSTIQAQKKTLWFKLSREVSRAFYRRGVAILARRSAAPKVGGINA